MKPSNNCPYFSNFTHGDSNPQNHNGVGSTDAQQLCYDSDNFTSEEEIDNFHDSVVPKDLYSLILQYLSPRAAISSMSVNKFWNQCVLENWSAIMKKNFHLTLSNTDFLPTSFKTFKYTTATIYYLCAEIAGSFYSSGSPKLKPIAYETSLYKDISRTIKSSALPGSLVVYCDLFNARRPTTNVKTALKNVLEKFDSDEELKTIGKRCFVYVQNNEVQSFYGDSWSLTRDRKDCQTFYIPLKVKYIISSQK